jgi:hypothetical protein
MVLLACFYLNMTEKTLCQLSVFDRGKLMRYSLIRNKEKEVRKKKHVPQRREKQAIW